MDSLQIDRMTEFDDPIRAALHASVERETAGDFAAWARKHSLSWIEVFRAAGFGGIISDAVAREIGPRGSDS